MPGKPGDWIGTVQRIAKASGLLAARRVLYFGSGFTVTDNETDGRTEVVLTSTAPAYLPLEDLIAQPELAATGNSVTVLALGNSEGPSLINQLDLFLTDSVTADVTDYRVIQIRDVDPLVGIGMSVLVVEYYTDLVSIDPLISPFTWTPYELAAGHFLAASWSSQGAGVVIPNGVWRIKQ